MNDPSLRRRARDRPLITPELHLPNDYYGYAHLLKRWAGAPGWRPLAAVVEHGVPLQPEIWHVDLESLLPTLLCTTSDRAAAYVATAAAGRVAAPIGPPIAYARDPSEPLVPPRPVDGPVLAFPAHSSHHVEARFDAERFADELMAVRGRWGAVRVCLYWRDVLAGAAEPYRRRGLECVTAGHMFDRGFLPRLRGLLAEAGAVVTNEMGTHVVYAALFGRPTWIVPQPIDYHDRREDPLRFVAPESERAAMLFVEERPDVTPEQAAFAAQAGGLEHVRSPQELSALLADAHARLRGMTTGRERVVWRARVGAHQLKEAAALRPALRGRA